MIDLETARFSLSLDQHPEALLLSHALLSRQQNVIRDLVALAGSLNEARFAALLRSNIDVFAGKSAREAFEEAIAGTPECAREILATAPAIDPHPWTYFDVIGAAQSADEVFSEYAKDQDPFVAAVAVSGLSEIDPDTALLFVETTDFDLAEKPDLVRAIANLAEERSGRAGSGRTRQAHTPLVLDERGRGCFFLVWYGSKVIELRPGMTAISVNKREDLPDAIRAIMDAVRFGELDIQIEDVAEKGTAELRLKALVKQLKKAG